jgi:hypothetical protein
MARMPHEELLRQLGLIEDALKRIRSLVLTVKLAQSRPELEASARRNIESLANECTLLIALFGNLVAALKEIYSECDVRLSWFMALPKKLQERYLTKYGSKEIEYLLKTVGERSEKLFEIVTVLSQNLVKGMARLKQEDASLINEIEQEELRGNFIENIFVPAESIAEDFAKAVELQNALASEASAKPARASLFSRLFGFRPAPATT